MTNYYFLAIALPELRIGDPLDITFDQLLVLLKDNLSDKDFKQVEVLLRYYDIENIRSLWKGEELDVHGNFNSNELEDAIITQEGLPKYVYNFIEKYPNVQDGLKHFPELLSCYMDHEVTDAHGFLHKYLEFEQELQIVLAAFRARKLGRDIIHELQYEDPENPIVSQIIAQKDSPEYEPPEKFEGLKAAFEINQNNPLELFKSLCEYRFDFVEKLLDMDYFSSNRILGYLIQYIIVENWLKLDKQKGVEIMDHILKEIS